MPRAFSAMTTTWLEMAQMRSMVLLWPSLGCLKTVCKVVTTGFRRASSRSRMYLPSSPPKIPYSCWRHTTSTEEMFRNSAASV